MLELFKLILSVFLITIVLLGVSKRDIGLTTFSTRAGLGSPTSFERFLNLLIIIAILIFVGIATYLNLKNN